MTPQEISTTADRIFSWKLRSLPHWAVRDQQDQQDCGIDYEVEIKHAQKATGRLFKLQQKGVAQVRFSDGEDTFPYSGLEVERVDYYLRQINLPTLLVVVDLATNSAFWVRLRGNPAVEQALVEARRNHQETMTVRVPVANIFPATSLEMLRAAEWPETLLRTEEEERTRQGWLLSPLPSNDQEFDAPLELPVPSPRPQNYAEETGELRAQIAETFTIGSTTLLSWPTTLDDGRTRLEPKQTEEVNAGFVDPEGSTTLLLGEPGSGKSALLATVGVTLVKEGRTVLAIKADTLPNSISSLSALGEYLNLPRDPLTCVRFVAETEDVFVLVDQLDALADLVDQHSGRLNVILHLIRGLADCPRVHVLASCREFEYRHDTRLTAINARSIRLELPTWEEVVTVLAQHGVRQVAGWPQALRDLLRPPQHLKIFLSVLRGDAEPELFSSYQQMMEKLWVQRVTNCDGLPGRSELLDALATKMGDEETLWLPAVRYEEQASLVDQLEAAGILMRSADGLSLGFRHQTLFNHAFARAFARGQHGHGRLLDHVLARQHALFVRPTLWSILTYLRGADPSVYRREFAALWSSRELRLHVRYLLLDFLGQLDNPDEQEAGWLLPCLEDDDLRGRVLRATVGRKGWFERLSQTYLPMLMRRDDEQSLNEMIPVLSEAWRTSHDGVLALIQSHWKDDPSKDAYTWSTLESLGRWEARTVDLGCLLIGRSEVADGRVMGVAATISAVAPTLAPRVIAVAMGTKLTRLLANPTLRPVLREDATEVEEMLWEIRHPHGQEFMALLEQGTGWYALAEVGEAAPTEYLEALWPWFLKVLQRSASPPNDIMHRYCHDVGVRTMGESPVLDSIEDSLMKFAENQPDEFLQFAQRWVGEDLMSVQQLLAKGMAKLAPTHPQAALDFLLADTRRFALGGFQDRDCGSIALVKEVVPHLSTAEKQRLEAAISGWMPYRTGVLSRRPTEERRRAVHHVRRARLRLLAAFTSEHLSAETRVTVVRERRALPGAFEPDFTVEEWGAVKSPMSVEQMARASDENLLALCAELTDETESDHPRRRHLLMGGNIEAAQAFAELAKRQPDRVAGLLGSFLPGRQERPVAYAVDSLAESTFPPADLIDLILTLDGGGFRGAEFRSHVTSALEKLMDKGQPFSEAVCRLLEGWLAPVQVTARVNEDRVTPASKEPPKGSVLWKSEDFTTLPQGSYGVLATLSRAYLARVPVEADRWLALLECRMGVGESEATWKALCRFLRYLGHANHPRAMGFMRSLFTRFPGVRDSKQGAVLLAQVRGWIDPEFLRLSMEAMRDSGWFAGPQVYGELLPLLSLSPYHHWASEELERILTTRDDGDPASASVRLGVAHAGANLWTTPRFRESATHVLTTLAASIDPDINRAVMGVFRVADVLLPDKYTTELLNTLLAYPGVLDVAESSLLVNRLGDVLLSRPELVVRLAEVLVEQLGAKSAETRAAAMLPTAELVDLAMTIQRFEGELRLRGLALFERLMVLNVPEARGTLSDLDGRPTGGSSYLPRRMPRRPRHR